MGGAARSPSPLSDTPSLFPVEMERALVHAALVDPDVLARSTLPPEAFSRPEYSRVWRALRELQEEGIPIDAPAVFHRAGIPQEVAEEVLFCGSSAYAWEYYEEEVRQAWLRRRAIPHAESFISRLISGASVQEAAPDLFEALEAVILDLPSDPAPLKEGLDSLEAKLMGLEPEEGRPVSVALCPHGSELLSVAPGELHLMAAPTGIGKSVLALQIARAVERAGWPVVVYSLEMGLEEWVARYLVQTGHLSPDKVRGGPLTKEELALLKKGREDLEGRRIYVQTEVRTKEALLADIRRQRRRLGARFFVIDYMGLVELRAEKGTSRWQALEEFANSLKSLARELKVAVLAVHQLNRGGEMEGTKGLHNWGDSYGMVRPADGAYILVRKREAGNGGARVSEKGEWRKEKVRNGRLGVVHLVFDEARLSFREEGCEE